MQENPLNQPFTEFHQLLLTIIKTSPLGIIVIDTSNKVRIWNQAAQNIFGWTESEITDLPLPNASEMERREFLQIRNSIEGGANIIIKRTQWLRKDGQLIDVSLSASPLKDDEGNLIGFIGIFADITEHVKAERTSQESEQLYRVLAEKSFASVFVVQDGVFRYINLNGANYAGYSPKQMIGKRSELIIHPDDRYKAKKRASEMLKGTRSAPYEFRVLNRMGGIRWIMETVTSITYEGRPAILGNSMDVTERKKMEEEIRLISITDPLTGLYNRRGFMLFAEQQFNLAKRNNTELLLFYLDLDNLKHINDSFGHEEGDAALIRASGILKSTFRITDIIARVGGDEFAILIDKAPEVTAEQVLSRLTEKTIALNEENKRYKVSMSIGISDFNPLNPCSIDDLLSRADREMYKNKRNRRQQHTVLI